MRKKYQKPGIVFEKFTPNVFVAACDEWIAKYSRNALTTLYFDDDGNGYWNSTETLTTPALTAGTEVTFSLEENISKGYMGTSSNPATLGNPLLLNQQNSSSSKKYYKNYIPRSREYQTSPTDVFKLLATNNKTYYFEIRNYSSMIKNNS